MKTKKMMLKTMKTMLISLFALLLLAAQAQAQRQPLAVLVVGVDNWMFGDVIAHIVGEELKRGNPNLVPVTREKFVQDKLKALRRATGEIDFCELRDWAKAQGLSQVCLVEAKKGVNNAFSFTNNTQQSYSAHRINVAGADADVFCMADFIFEHTGAPREMTSVELTKVAWEAAGRLQSSSCKAVSRIRCYSFGPDDPEMVFVEGGAYLMGRTSPVELSDFWIGKYEVTQKEWIEVMGTKTGISFGENWGAGDNFPAYAVSYDDAQAFISALNTLTGKTYRLPTEAEWEYAARGGSKPKFCKNGCEFSGSNTLNDVAWNADNSREYHSGSLLPQSHAVGTRAANELGIYDMSGNAAEWCLDWYADDLPSGKNPQGPEIKTSDTMSDKRLRRGGNFSESSDLCNVFFRDPYYPFIRAVGNGFRVVLP
jgi:formylglycine-generating enzyme required for sulfatase activity